MGTPVGCCHLDDLSSDVPSAEELEEAGCFVTPEWEVYWEEDGKAPFDTFTDSCSLHLAEMIDGVLEDARGHTEHVVRLSEDVE